MISIFPENAAQGRQSHQGLIVLFEPEAGTPVCVVHAGEVTAIRTAAASAVATDALARKDAKHLAILGTGEQAATHAPRHQQSPRTQIHHHLGPLARSEQMPLPRSCTSKSARSVTAHTTVEQAVANADIICTLTSASEPILKIGMGPARPAHQRSRLQPCRSRRDR